MSNFPEEDKKPTSSVAEPQKQSASLTEGAHATPPAKNISEPQKQSASLTEGAHATPPAKNISEPQKESASLTEGAHATPPAKNISEPQKQSASLTEGAHATPPAKDPLTSEPAVINRSARTTWNRFLVRSHLWFKQWRDTWIPLINVFVAILAFIVITLQGRIYNEQKEIMNKQSEFMDQQTGIMEKSFRVSERAYVGVASVEANLETREILIMLQNIGHVPAAAVKLQCQYIWATPKGHDQKGVVFPWDAGAVDLFPGTPMPVVVPLIDIEQNELNAISSRTKILYIGGTIKYDDGFKNLEQTTFAFRYEPKPQNRWIAHSDLSKVFKDIAR